MLVETLIAAAFLGMSVPCGYISRRFRDWEPWWKKWAVYLGVVHAPVIPLIAFVKLAGPAWEFEALLVAVVLVGHVTGVLAWRARNPQRAVAPVPAAE